MRRMKMDERGLTLVEVLATFVIMAIVGFVAYSVLYSGFRTYDRVKIEAGLRDEADLIMSELVSEMFVIKESEIAQKRLPEPGTRNYYIEKKDGKRTGFIDGKLWIDGDVKTNVLNSGLIEIEPNQTKIEELGPDSGQYQIVLTLKSSEDKQTLTTESVISTINDLDEGAHHENP